MPFEVRVHDSREASQRAASNNRRRRNGSNRGRAAPQIGAARSRHDSFGGDSNNVQPVQTQSENKDEQAELFWQDVEKNWFGPVPDVLLSAIDRHLALGCQFLKSYSIPSAPSGQPLQNSIGASCDIPMFHLQSPRPTPVQITHMETIPLELPLHQSVAAASVTLTPDDGKENPFCGPWQFLSAQSYLADLFGASGNDANPEVYHKILSSSSAIDLLNLDVYICSLLGFPLMDGLDQNSRDLIKKTLTNKRNEKFSMKSSARDSQSPCPDTGNPVSPKSGARLCSLEFLMHAFGLTPPGARLSVSRPIPVLEQAFSELQAKSQNQVFSVVRSRGNPHAVRFLLSLPLSGFRLSNYPKEFVDRLKNLKDWPEFLQALCSVHLDHRHPRQLATCRAITSAEVADDDKGQHHHHRHHDKFEIRPVFGLPRTIVGPQLLWTNGRSDEAKRGRPVDFSQTASPAKRLKQIAREIIPLSSSPRELFSSDSNDAFPGVQFPLSPPPFNPSWSMVADSSCRQLTTIDGVEVEDNPYLIFRSPRKYRRVLLQSGVFDDPLRVLDTSPIADDNTSTLNTSPTTSVIPELNSGHLNIAKSENMSSYTDELDQEHLNLLDHLKSIVETKCYLLNQLRDRVQTKLQSNEAFWKDTEHKMVELYRQEFFNHSISGRHAYTLARQYREMDFVRMLAPNGNELPSWWTEQALCCVCGSGMAFDDDPIIFCDACFLPVHHGCVGYQSGNPFAALDVPELGAFGSASDMTSSEAIALKEERRYPTSPPTDDLGKTAPQPATSPEPHRRSSESSSSSPERRYSDFEESSENTRRMRREQQMTSQVKSGEDSESSGNISRANSVQHDIKLEDFSDLCVANKAAEKDEESSPTRLGEESKDNTADQSGTVEEEWFCHSCQMVIHQIGDVPTAIVVIRHIAGPRTPKEFQEALTHEKVAELPLRMNWYLPSLVDENNQPIMMREHFDHAEKTGGSSNPMSEVSRKSSLMNGCVKASSISENASVDSASNKRKGDLSCYRNKRQPDTPRTSECYTTGSTKRPENDMPTPQISSSTDVKTEGGVNPTGRGRGKKRGRPRLHRPSPMPKMKIETPPVITKRTKDQESHVEISDSLPPTAEPTPAVIGQPALPLSGMQSRRQYLARLHTKCPTHWYIWKVTVEEQQIERCRASLLKSGVRRRRRGSGGSSSSQSRTADVVQSKRTTRKALSLELQGLNGLDARREWRISGLPGYLPPVKKDDSNLQRLVSDDVVDREPTLEFVVRIPCCSLCGYDPYFKGGGVIKKGISSRKRREFAHIRCALGIDGMLAPDALRYTVEPERARLRCNFCNQSGPAPVQCGHAQCPKPYHVSCGTQALECVSEFSEVRPIIYCNTHSKEKPPTQALRLYQQSLEKQKRIKKRIDEERAPFSSSPSNLSSWFLRSLVSSYNISATSLDVLFPHSMCPLLCPTQRINPCKEVSSPQNGPQTRTAEDVVSGPTGFVKSRNRAMRKNSFASLSANVLSPSVLSRCPNGVLDILGSSRSGNDSPTAHTDEAFNDDCSDLNSEVNFLTAIRVSGASHGILDSSLWESSGLFCGSLTEGFSSQTTVSHSNGIQEHTTQLSAEEAEVGGSYQVYQGKVGSLGVQSMTDMAIRLFLYLKGFPPGSTDLKKLSDVVFSTAKSWDLCGLQWVINSSIVLSHEVPSGWKPSSKNLTKALISSANVEEVFDHWICCACGKEVQLWSAYGQSPKDFLEGISASPEALPNLGFRCSCCGCCICSVCCSSHCSLEQLSQISPSLVASLSGEQGPSAFQIEADGDPVGDSESFIVHRKNRLFNVLKKPRTAEKAGEEEDDSDVAVTLQLQRLMEIVSTIVNLGHFICPRCEFFFWRPLQLEKKVTQTETPPHPSLIGSCVLCNRSDGFLVKRQGCSLNTASFSSVPPTERYDQSAGVHWVHPCCAEWFVPPKLKGSGIRYVGRVLKKYGCRRGGWQDTSIVTTTVTMSRPEPSLSCYICSLSTGALWTCSHPKCTQGFHISCARLWGCKFDQQNRRNNIGLSSSALNPSNSAVTRRAYCGEHSFTTIQQSQTWFKDSDLVTWLTSLAMTNSCWSSSLMKRIWICLNGGEPVDLALQLVQSFISGVGCLPLVFPSGLPSYMDLNWTVGRGALGELSLLRAKCKVAPLRPEKKMKKTEDASDHELSSDGERQSRFSPEEFESPLRGAAGKSLSVFVRTQAALLDEISTAAELENDGIGKIRKKEWLENAVMTDSSDNEQPQEPPGGKILGTTGRKRTRSIGSASTSSNGEDEDLEACIPSATTDACLAPIVAQREFWLRENKRRVLGREPGSLSSHITGPHIDRLQELSPDVNRRRRIMTDDMEEEFELSKLARHTSTQIPRRRRSNLPVIYGPDGQPMRRPRGRPRKYPSTAEASARRKSEKLRKAEQRILKPQRQVQQEAEFEATPSPILHARQAPSSPMYQYPYSPMASQMGPTTPVFRNLMVRSPGLRMMPGNSMMPQQPTSPSLLWLPPSDTSTMPHFMMTQSAMSGIQGYSTETQFGSSSPMMMGRVPYMSSPQMMGSSSQGMMNQRLPMTTPPVGPIFSPGSHTDDLQFFWPPMWMYRPPTGTQ